MAAPYPVNIVRAVAGGSAHPGFHRQRINADGTKVTSPAIFFDNDEAKIDQIASKCNDIELVRVPEANIAPANPSAINPAYAALWTPHNIYFNAYTRVHAANGTPHQFFDIYSGMQLPEIAIINDWIVRSAELGVQRTAIFDWDRTLTMVEGLVIPIPGPAQMALTLNQLISTYPPFKFTGAPLTYVEDMLIYLCGGPIRLQSIRDMFASLRANDVNIAILTNNPVAGDNRRALFKELVVALIGIPGYEPEIRCSFFSVPPGDKGVVMKDMFPGLCGAAMAGGGKRRRGRRTTKRRRGRRTRRRI